MFFKSFSSVLKEYAVWATSDHPRVGTGFQFFDTRTNGGVASGEVLLLQARSSVGKTTIANNILVNNKHLPSAFMSLEMHGRYIANRIAAISQGTSTKQIEYELKTKQYSSALQRTAEEFPKLAIFDKPAMSLKNMGEAINEAENEFQEHIQLVVIDFLELIGGVPSLSAVEKIDQLARKVKDFAREFDTAVLLLTQVGRGEGGAGHEPLSLTAARYGGETSADYVLGAYRPCLRPGITQAEYELEKWQIYFQFLKSRGGSDLHPGGALHMFNPESMRITEWQHNQPELWDSTLDARLGPESLGPPPGDLPLFELPISLPDIPTPEESS